MPRLCFVWREAWRILFNISVRFPFRRNTFQTTTKNYTIVFVFFFFIWSNTNKTTFFLQHEAIIIIILSARNLSHSTSRNKKTHLQNICFYVPHGTKVQCPHFSYSTPQAPVSPHVSEWFVCVFHDTQANANRGVCPIPSNNYQLLITPAPLSSSACARATRLRSRARWLFIYIHTNIRNCATALNMCICIMLYTRVNSTPYILYVQRLGVVAVHARLTDIATTDSNNTTLLCRSFFVANAGAHDQRWSRQPLGVWQIIISTIHVSEYCVIYAACSIL